MTIEIKHTLSYNVCLILNRYSVILNNKHNVPLKVSFDIIYVKLY